MWSGEGELNWSGEVWLGTQGENGASVGISPVTDAIGTKNRRATISLAVPAEVVRDVLAVDVGPTNVYLRYLYSTDYGKTWVESPIALAGKLSQPRFQLGVYTVEIETWAGDADRGEPKFWSDETQRVEHPGDKGFEFVRALEQGLETRWPP